LDATVNKNPAGGATKEPDPEKLLKLLEMELEAARSKRVKTKGSRNSYRVLSIALLLAGTFAAVAALQYVASTLHRPQHAATSAPAVGETKHPSNF
jgi:hypothetical protein